jgi:SAM-dependent methyltransferase
MNDVFGTALLDFQTGKCKEDILTSTSISDEEPLSVSYLFRTYDEMPKLEQTALELVKGSILDIGCGAGSHSLHLKAKGFKVKSIDISPKAIECCQLRGLDNAEVLNVLDETQRFDTLLLLMNGSGVFQSLEETPKVLNHLKKLLNKNGQILIDSSDIKYMFEDDDGGVWLDMHNAYYGELAYTVRYKGKEDSFKWMYLDFDRLKTACSIVGLQCIKIEEGPHHDFLAQIKKKE